MTPCPACGQSLAVGVRTCLACGADMTGPQRPKTLPSVAERRLWALVKGPRRVECAVRQTPLGPELRVSVDGELFWSHVYRGASDDLPEAADAKRQQFTALGWVVAGPRNYGDCRT